MFMFWIDGHDMKLIEVDGTDTEESPIDLISVSAGQRYSVLITARNDTDLKELGRSCQHGHGDVR